MSKSKKVADPPSPPTPLVVCSFCGKDQTRVDRMIVGPACAICDECVGVCAEVILCEVLHGTKIFKLAEDYDPETRGFPEGYQR